MKSLFLTYKINKKCWDWQFIYSYLKAISDKIVNFVANLN